MCGNHCNWKYTKFFSLTANISANKKEFREITNYLYKRLERRIFFFPLIP